MLYFPHFIHGILFETSEKDEDEMVSIKIVALFEHGQISTILNTHWRILFHIIRATAKQLRG